MKETQNAITATTNARPTGLSIFDQGAFEQMGLIASKLAESSLIPQTLKGATKEETAANCFRVVEQAQRWGLSPFAVMDSASVVHGKLMWEGKLIHAALTASLGVRLRYEYEGAGDARKVIVSGTIDGDTLTVEGTVKDWKTTGKGSPWDNLANRDQMLAYRGARQWARRHAPEVILGVYSPDEFEASEIRNVTPATTKARPKVSAAVAFPTPEPEPEPTLQPEPQPVEIVEPKGKQRKERYEQRVTFLDVSAPKTSNGKTWWTCQVQTDQGATVELNTFSRTLAGRLEELFNGDPITVTFTQTAKGGFALEDIATGEELV
jgi:hypothetical protein